MASIFFRIVIIFAFLTVSMRIMGKRQIGELEVGELIVTFLISEIATIPIQAPEIPLLNAIVPVLFIVNAEIITSALKNKSARLKKIFDGKAVFLIYEGKFSQSVLKNNRLSLEEFAAAMHQAGIGKIEDIQYCILEANGKISMIEKENGGELSHIIISDGEICEENLSILGLNENWLKKTLNGKSAEEVFLLTVNNQKDVYMLLKEGKT